jgi:hypothetical protein
VSVDRGESRGKTTMMSFIRAAIVGLSLGVLTAYAQQWLPSETASLANSTGSWMLVAFLLALLATSRLEAVGCASLALISLVTGYYAAIEFRGFEHSTRTVVFWVAAAALVGPPIGVAASWVRFARPQLAALGGAVPVGLLVGEGIYGLRYVADTTYPPFWIGEILVGIALFSVIAATRLREWRWILLMLGAASAVSAAFVLVFSLDVISLL